ncbi:MAG: ATP-binding protein [Muribaculaceae bacterium]|nr:ATP-binding protein [Muribaculaceae bacterium]
MKSRFLSPTIRDNADSSNGRILIITGARQTGKTTMVKALFPEYRYLTLEDPVLRHSYTSLTSQQWHDLYPMAILDEVQKAPQLIESVKAVYDQWEEPRYILLGSSQILLLRKIKESLAGRCHIIELYPLTLPEIMSEANIDAYVSPSALQQLLNTGKMPPLLPSLLLDTKHATKLEAWHQLYTYGGYPALTAASRDHAQRQQWLDDYVHTYLERDIRDLVAMRDLEPYVKLQHLLALNTACTINIADIARTIGVSAKTVTRYMEYLELSYQAILLPAWDRNDRKRLTKAPKIHYLDAGVIRAITTRWGALSGNEFESLIVSEIYKQAKQLPTKVGCHHLRTADGREVDLLLETGQGYYAFEIKTTEHASRTDARHLRALEEVLDKPLLHSFVVSQDPVTTLLGDNITAVHALTLLT